MFETEICGRCGGSGQNSYNQMHGTVCYGCGGKGKRFTKRGAAAFQFYQNLLKVPAAALEVGDKIQVETMSHRYFATITAISRALDGGKSLQPDGTWKVNAPGLDIATTHPVRGNFGLGNWPDAAMVRKAWSAEYKQEAMRKAMAFQLTLTRAGKAIKAA